MKKFVIVSTQRTGSTLLMRLLDSHPKVLCPGEIFFPGAGNAYALRHRVESSFEQRFRHLIARKKFTDDYLIEFYGQDGFDAIGFKYMYSQSRYIPRLYPSVLQYILDQRIPVIHSIRENYLRVVLSRIVSKSTGVYHANKASGPPPPVELPVKRLVSELDNLRMQDVSWSEKLSKNPYLKVTYESLQSDASDRLCHVQSFIGVDYEENLSTPFVQLSNASLSERISNYSAVEKALTGSDFEYCLQL